MIRRYLYKQNAVPLIAAIVTVFISLHFQFSVQTFNTFDAFYHSAQSVAYYTGNSIPYPYFSSFTDYPADIWIGYHYILGLFHYVIPGDSHLNILHESYYFHAILGGVAIWLWLTVYGKWQTVVAPLLQTIASRHGLSASNVLHTHVWLWQGVMYVTLLLFFFDAFFRVAINQRPHILLLIIVLSSVLALINKRYWLLFFLFMTAPFVYSVSWLVFMPIIGLLLGWVLCGGTRRGWGMIAPALMSSVFGYVTGLILHPQSLGYIINGLFFGVFAIFHSAIGWMLPGLRDMPSAGEMHFLHPGFGIEKFALIVFAGIAFYYIRSEAKDSRAPLEQAHVLHIGLLAMSGLLLVASIFVYRLIEYAVPLGLLTITPFMVFIGIPYATRVHRELFAAMPVYRSVSSRIEQIPGKTYLFCIYVFLIVAGTLLTISLHKPGDFYRLQGAAEFLSQVTIEAPIVIATYSHDFYAPLVFFGDFECRDGDCARNMSRGMDNRMTYLYDPDFNAAYDQFIGYTLECYVEKACGFEDPADTKRFMIEHGIKYIVHDEDLDLMNDLRNKIFSENPYLTLEYTDERYPSVKVYSLK